MLRNGLQNMGGNFFGQGSALFRKGSVNALGVKMAGWHQDWSCFVLPRSVFTVIHGHVSEATLQSPDNRKLLLRLVVAQLEASDGPIITEPDNEVKVVGEKPATSRVTGNLTYFGEFSHGNLLTGATPQFA